MQGQLRESEAALAAANDKVQQQSKVIASTESATMAAQAAADDQAAVCTPVVLECADQRHSTSHASTEHQVNSEQFALLLTALCANLRSSSLMTSPCTLQEAKKLQQQVSSLQQQLADVQKNADAAVERTKPAPANDSAAKQAVHLQQELATAQKQCSELSKKVIALEDAVSARDNSRQALQHELDALSEAKAGVLKTLQGVLRLLLAL